MVVWRELESQLHLRIPVSDLGGHVINERDIII